VSRSNIRTINRFVLRLQAGKKILPRKTVARGVENHAEYHTHTKYKGTYLMSMLIIIIL